ncbi:MAG: purine-nucleoside phosphorylase [Acidimicrobiia bacterium]|nr:purine-nucleoside phosphorylase [Acidimicrobiia bacterium]
MPTPHISAEPDDYATTVLMPGDPLRARYIAESFLDGARQVTDVRSMFGYTGSYRGVPVSVQGSGMGIPSIQIYATELAKVYGVERIVRVGSCGAIQDDIDLRDVVIGLAAGTDSTVNRTRFGGRDFPAAADWSLLRAVVDTAEQRSITHHVGTVFSADFFYEPEGSETFALLERYGVLAVEMEAAGLYGVAAEYGIAALTVATVSDQIKRGEALSADERESSFDEMMTLVLDAVTAS